MVSFTKDLILHFSLIVFLGFMYNYLYMQRREIHQRKWFIGSVFLAASLTMIFPVEFDQSLYFDLKLIPFFICMFYIGPAVSIGLLGLIIGVQSFITGSFVPIILLNYTIIFILFLSLRKFYSHKSLKNKLLIGLGVILIVGTTRAGALLIGGSLEQIILLLIYTFVSFIALAGTIYIIEMTNFQLKTINELHKAEKFSAISQLAASVAHEIRNPMTTIRGFMQILQNDRSLPGNYDMFLSVSLQELDRTQTIIDNFLSLAKPNNSRKHHLDLTALLYQIIEFMKPYAHMANINISSEIEENLQVNADSQEVRQLLINIIKNGIEAMEDGGNFTIHAYIRNEDIYIELVDEGIGMNKKQLERLGNPYYSTKEKGTGLGLMISYDIVNRMKGSIKVDSQMGIGTKFTILLPAVTHRIDT